MGITVMSARATVPGWVIGLGIGAFLAPAGVPTTVMLAALALACIPAVISVAGWKRTTSGRAPASFREPAAIDAAYTVEDVTPASHPSHQRAMKETRT